MKNLWPTSSGLSVILAVAIGLVGCASLRNPSPANTSTAPATIAYVLGPVGAEITAYSTIPANSGSPVRSLILLSPYTPGPIATDLSANIYVGAAVNPIDPNNMGDILIYPPNSTGTATASRMIHLDDYPNRLAVDPVGRVYVLNLGQNYRPSTVAVYAAGASGAATPLRTLVLTGLLSPVSDMVADAAGNLYVAGYLGNGWTVAVYSPTANGPSSPAKTIDFGLDGSSIVYGVAVDSAGDIFANVGSSTPNGPTLIEEFSPQARGAATPINTINLTAVSSWQITGGGPVRVDGAGNIFTSLQLISPEMGQLVIVFYGFPPHASGDAVPTVQVVPPGGGYNSFLALN